MKSLIKTSVLALLLIATSLTPLVNAQSSNSKGKGPTESIPVYFQSANPNEAIITITDQETNVTYTLSSLNGNTQMVQVPKHHTFQIMFYMTNTDNIEQNYWMLIGGTTGWVGITLQPGETRGAGGIVPLDRESSLTITDVRPTY